MKHHRHSPTPEAQKAAPNKAPKGSVFREKKPRFARLRTWVRSHPRKALVIFGAVLILLAASIAAALYLALTPAEIKIGSVTVRKPAPTYYSPLTGIKVADEAATKQPVTAIMIENSPDARPQSGIKQAGIVYEAIAEGGITRFLALYQEAKPGLIGPVRSVRMYYVDWAAAYDASIAHVGGSFNALQEVRNGSYRDIDQFFNAGSYWRAGDRAAPHNVYTSFQNLDELNRSKGYTESHFTGFPRTDSKVSATPNATSVDINISSAWYNTHYDFDAASNTYLRSIGGEASNDREDGRIAPNVIVALKVDMTNVFEDGWRENITTIGQGGAVIFQNGTATEVTWRKTDRKAPLELLDAEGKPIKLNRGQTWIAAVPNGSGSIGWK